MALTIPICGSTQSNMRNQDNVLLMAPVEYDQNGKIIQPKIEDFYLPIEYMKVKDTPNAKMETMQQANKKYSTSEIVNYDPELEFEVMLSQVDPLGKKLNEFKRARHVSLASHWHIMQINGVVNEKIVNNYVTGEGFKYTLWTGPLTVTNAFAIGDDDKFVTNQFKLKPNDCLHEGELIDPKLLPLVALYSKGEKWDKAGYWDNTLPGKLVPQTK